MNCVEKIIARRTWKGHDAGFGINSVKPGDQVMCETGFRGMHEYTGGMVMALYAEEWGKAPVKNPELVAAFEDHFVLIDRDTVPLRVKNQRLNPARRLRDEASGRLPVEVPENARLSSSGNSWTCNRPYKRTTSGCEAR